MGLHVIIFCKKQCRIMKIVYCQLQHLTLNKILLREKMDHEMRENTHSSNRSWIIIKKP